MKLCFWDSAKQGNIMHQRIAWIVDCYCYNFYKYQVLI